MERRQNGGYRRYIVQEFIKDIADDTERLVCFLYMQGYKNTAIGRMLHLNPKRLSRIRIKLAADLHKAGIRNTEG